MTPNDERVLGCAFKARFPKKCSLHELLFGLENKQVSPSSKPFPCLFVLGKELPGPGPWHQSSKFITAHETSHADVTWSGVRGRKCPRCGVHLRFVGPSRVMQRGAALPTSLLELRHHQCPDYVVGGNT